jgi:putative colanic acid biosynthesis acetyltransferase WcaF
MHNTDTFTGPSFSISNRTARLVWHIADLLLFKYSPKTFFIWRSFVLRCFGAKIGSGVHVYPKVDIWAPWNLTIGDQSGIANGVILYSQGKIIIGKKSIISQGSHLVTGTHDYTKNEFPLKISAITIGDNVWVAADTFIHPGISIGNGSIIGARSVVTKNLPPWMVCSGHPCKVIKPRILE